jgi:DNA polymerase-3 subunit delta
VTGPEPVLVERELDELVSERARMSPDLDVVRLDCTAKPDRDDAGAAAISERLAQAMAPSLFGDAPIVVVLGLEAADDHTQTILKRAIDDPEGSPIVISHNGSSRGRGVINVANKAKARVTKVKRANEREVRSLMRQTAKESGGRLTPPAEQWLVDAIGTDSLALLLAAVDQSVRDSPDGTVAEEHVHAIFPMQAKVSSFKVVDHLWAGRLDDAVRLLRQMEMREKGVGVAVVAAISHGLRMMALFGRPGAQVPQGMNVAPWQIDRASQNARRWRASGARIAKVAVQLPDLDATMKGGLADGIALDDEQKMAVLEVLIVRLSAGPEL